MQSTFSCCAVLSLSVVSDSLQPHGAQPTRLLCPWGFSRQEHWSGLPCPPPGDLPNPGTKPRSPALQVDSLPSEPSGKPLPKIISCQFSLCYCSNILHKVPILCMCQVHSVYSVRYFVALEEIRGDLWQLGMPIPGPVIKRHLVLCVGFPGSSAVKNPPGKHETSSIPGSGRPPGEGNGNSFQYSCLGNTMDRGAWWVIVHGVANSWT